MAATFDPYYVWLGIAPEEQPADAYRLLGIRRFEPNPEVISSASDRQLAHIRTFQSGPRSAESQILLQELSIVTRRLLDPEAKARYDAELRASIAPQPAPVPITPMRLPVAQPLPIAQPILPQAAPVERPIEFPPYKLRPISRPARGELPPAIAAVCIILGIGGAIAGVLFVAWFVVDGTRQPIGTTTAVEPAKAPSSKPMDPAPKLTEPNPTESKPAEPPKPEPVQEASKPGVIKMRRTPKPTTEPKIEVPVPIYKPPPPAPVKADRLAKASSITPLPVPGSSKTPEFKPLQLGARSAYDGLIWSNIAPELSGLSFLQNDNSYQGIVGFTVNVDGDVVLAVGSNFGGGGGKGGGWLQECKTHEQLNLDGWKDTGLKFAGRGSREGDLDYEQIVLIRECKAGERFSIRTEKYFAPVVIAAAAPEPAAKVGQSEPPTGDVLTIYNTHNWNYGGRGTKTCNVQLRLGAKEVWRKDDIALAWDITKKTNPPTTIQLPDVKYNVVRVEVATWHEGGCGLAEIEVLHDGKNIAQGKPVLASEPYDPNALTSSAPQMVNDGIKDESGPGGGDGKGYWLLPGGKAGWIEILVSGPAPKPKRTKP